MGNPGQADYATANAFMDAYAAWRNSLVASGQRRGRTLSINWPLWQEGRMRADREIERMVARRTGLVAMESAVGIRALAQALAADQDQVMVLHGDTHKLSAALSAARSGARHGQHRHACRTTSKRLCRMPRRLTSDNRHTTTSKDKSPQWSSCPPTALTPTPRWNSTALTPSCSMKMTNTLEETFGTLSKTLLFEYQSIRELTAYFLETYPDKLRSLLGPEAPSAHGGIPEPPVKQPSTPHPIERHHRQHSQIGRSRTHLVPTYQLRPSAYRRSGSPAISPSSVSADVIHRRAASPNSGTTSRTARIVLRRSPSSVGITERYFDPDKDKPGKTSCKWGGFIDGVDQFDPLFFNISPREAALMDPQERLFLETVWHLFEDDRPHPQAPATALRGSGRRIRRRHVPALPPV